MTGFRKRGRPPLAEGEESIELGLSLIARDLREVNAIASVERVSAQEIIRRAVAKFLRDRRRAASRARLPQSVILRRRLGV